jgi:hypothetical protein
MTTFALALATLAGQEITAVPEGDALIRVVSPGRFETTFTKRKGFGATWFDLKHDPAKTRDLAPVLDENGFFWIKIGQPGNDGSWYANPAEEMSLLESGPVRVRVRLRGSHRRYGSTDAKAAWPALRFEQTWTLAADGSAYVDYVLVQDQPVPYRHFLVITKANGAWGAQGKGPGRGEARVAGEKGEAKPTSTAPSSFTLQSTDGPTFFADILMVAQKGKFPAAYWNEGYQDKDLRCSFDLGSRWPEKVIPAGREPLNFLMRFADDIDAAAAKVHADDYRAPDRLQTAKGAVDTTDDGDRDADGFNEAEGCYGLRAAADGIAFTLHAKEVPRVRPVFKVRGWPGATPASITVGGRAVAVGRGLTASVREGTLLLQIHETLTEDSEIVVAPPKE